MRRFVCLADKEQHIAPDVEEQRELLTAGLGEEKLSVPESCEEDDLRDILLSSFPKLCNAGGFEFMYAESRTRDLKMIPPGPNGLTMKYLVAFIGQEKIFVRPIQQDLMTFPISHKRPIVKHSGELCNNCDEMVEVHHLREYKSTCGMHRMYCAELSLRHVRIMWGKEVWCLFVQQHFTTEWLCF